MRLRALISRRSPSPPKPSVVTRGLVDWFDFADGKGTETTLKSRVSDKVLTLSRFNFDANSGWTGKGLRFDGVDDNIVEPLDFRTTIVINLKIIKTNLYGTFLAFSVNDRLSYSNSPVHSYYKNFYYYNSLHGSSGTKESFEIGENVTFVFQEGNVFVNKNQATFLKGITDNPMKVLLCSSTTANTDLSYLLYSVKIYNVALTPEEIAQNYEYEQSIDRTTISTYPMLQEQKSYGVGLANQLSEEQKAKFRLSVDGTKFVAGLRYCEGLEVEDYTYSNIQKEMEKEEWSKIGELE